MLKFKVTHTMKIYNKKNEAAARKHRDKMLSWENHVGKIENHFRLVSEEVKTEGFIDNLYVSRNDEDRQIQLYSGRHPIWSSKETCDASGRVINRRLHAEDGAALVLSQSQTGEVTVILYPFKSEKLRRVQPYLIWAIYPEPKKVTDKVLRRVTHDFFRYMRVSSSLLSESVFDQLRIQYLEFRSKKYTKSDSAVKLVFSHWSWVFLGAVGSVASIYSLWG